MEIFVYRAGSNHIEEGFAAKDLPDLLADKTNVVWVDMPSPTEVLYRFSHGEFPMIEESTLPFYRDVHDHLLRIVDLSESYRDLVGGLSDIHLSVIANKTNEVMKVLAVFSAIMLPLSLIAGIYGMNFENMPELHQQNGYYVAIALMIVIAASLLVYFWRKGWIFEGENKSEVNEEKKDSR
ncbi:unnamed protein product [Rotaria sp. Silwood1]|nr:unnamed protein product [Rotaria sp. Silwood1]CAF5096716.1 unnamed protein product [Rotaria sp. Silwood1]